MVSQKCYGLLFYITQSVRLFKYFGSFCEVCDIRINTFQPLCTCSDSFLFEKCFVSRTKYVHKMCIYLTVYMYLSLKIRTR